MFRVKQHVNISFLKPNQVVKPNQNFCFKPSHPDKLLTGYVLRKTTVVHIYGNFIAQHTSLSFKKTHTTLKNVWTTRAVQF